MNKIEFKTKPSRRDFERVMVKKLCLSRIFGIFYLVVNILLIIVILQKLVGTSHEGSEHTNIIMSLCVCLAVGLLSPLWLGRGLARTAFKDYQRNPDMLFFLDNQGYGGKSDIFEFYVKWKGFDSIYENREYIFMKLTGGRNLIIFKNLLTHQTVSAIKEVLADVPVPKKKLIT